MVVATGDLRLISKFIRQPIREVACPRDFGELLEFVAGFEITFKQILSEGVHGFGVGETDVEFMICVKAEAIKICGAKTRPAIVESGFDVRHAGVGIDSDSILHEV